eukprot:7184129-Alexandrium_andersonii.AAC.1
MAARCRHARANACLGVGEAQLALLSEQASSINESAQQQPWRTPRSSQRKTKSRMAVRVEDLW